MIQLATCRTSILLDEPTWCALLEIAVREGLSVDQLCTAIDAERSPGLRFTDAVRLTVLRYYLNAATEFGHAKAGHGKKCKDAPATA